MLRPYAKFSDQGIVDTEQRELVQFDEPAH